MCGLRVAESDLEYRIDRLEERLLEYHSALNESIEQRDLLALDAAWGILTAAMGGAAFFGALYFVKITLGWNGWIGAGVGAVGALAAYVAAYHWMDRGRFQDREKLWKLPEWEQPDA